MCCWCWLALLASLIQRCLTVLSMPNASSLCWDKHIYMMILSWLHSSTSSRFTSHQGCCYDCIDTTAVTNIFPLATLTAWCLVLKILLFFLFKDPYLLIFFQLSQWKHMKFTLYITTFRRSLQLCRTVKWKHEVGGATRLWWCKTKTHKCPKSQCTSQYGVNFCLFYRVSWITQVYLKTAWGKLSKIMYMLPDYQSSDRNGSFLQRVCFWTSISMSESVKTVVVTVVLTLVSICNWVNMWQSSRLDL